MNKFIDRVLPLCVVFFAGYLSSHGRTDEATTLMLVLIYGEMRWSRVVRSGREEGE